MAWRVKIERLTVVYDGDLQILHLSQQLKATEQRCRHAVQDISLKLKSNVLSMECNYPIQEAVNVIFDRRLLSAANPSASNAR
jgi:hypothetical protein